MERQRPAPNLELDLPDVEAAKHGDREAFGRLYGKYAAKLIRFTYSKTGSMEDSEDIVADSFIKALTHIEGYDPKYSFYSWMARITRNTMIDTFRKSKAGSLPDNYDAKDTDEYVQPEQVFERKESLGVVHSLIDAIPSNRARRVVIFRYLEERSVPETAKLVGMTEGGVKSTAFRAVRQMRSEVTARK